MKVSKNLQALVPMTVSIILLLALEILWLRNAYRGEKEIFNKDTYYLFNKTVTSLQDSLIRKNIIPISPDSNLTDMSDIKIHNYMEFGLSHERNVAQTIPHNSDSKQFRVIFINADHDSTSQERPDRILKIIQPVLASRPSGKLPNTFLVNLSGDSININSLKVQYNKELIKADVHLPYRILIKEGNFNRREVEEGLNGTSYIHLNPSWVYSVHFGNTETYIIKKIMPQVLFCATLTLLILISFYSMFRSIRTNRRLMELKNDFISNVTHELKTPVSTVSVAIEALQNYNVMKDPDKALQYLDIASRELRRLSLMADKILSATVFEHKGVEFKMESVDLKQLAHQVLDSMQLIFDKGKANVILEEEGEDHRINGSPVHLMNVIYNLIDNALKYSQPGVQICIHIKSDSRSVELAVKDNGIGIAPEYQNKIFDKFSRIPRGDIHNSKGYGLGLNYVKEVVKGHHGTIDLVSKPGSGSTFTIQFPKSNG